MERYYKPLYKPNQVFCGSGQTAIVTGWTLKGTVKKKLEEHEYGAIGQLYSATRGINFLVRNLLWNPHIRFLIIMNGTKEDKNAGAAQCFLDFFRQGFEEGKSEEGVKCWKIKSKVLGYIDPEILLENLQLLRESIECHEATSITQAVTLAKRLAELGEKSEWATPALFPLVENLPTVLPGQRYGHRIEGKTIAETWVKIIHRIKTTGVLRPTGYDGQVQELIDLMAVVTDEPPEFFFPEPNYLPIDHPFLSEYIPQILEDAPYHEGIKYTYGQRMRSWFGRDQIEQVITKLINEIDAASAVINLWDSGCGNLFQRPDGSSDHEHSGSPCLTNIWVRVVDGELSLTATLRSNDMFGAWPANAMGLRALQQYIRDAIAQRSKYDLTMGPLVTLSQSAHLYDDTFETADRVIAAHYDQICNSRDYFDPAGNFVIELTSDEHGEKILVTQIPGSGKAVSYYSGVNAVKL